MADRFIYVIGSKTGPNKIGISNDVAKRLIYIRSASGQPHCIMHQRAVPADLAKKIERRAHWLGLDKRLNGEWFGLTSDEAAAIVDRAVEEKGEGESGPSGCGRPPLDRRTKTVVTTARLPTSFAPRITAIVGPNRMAAFIREAITRELRRREKTR